MMAHRPICRNRGQSTGTVQDHQGKPVKVYACAEHGACTLRDRVPDVAGCCNGGGGCKAYENEHAAAVAKLLAPIATNLPASGPQVPNPDEICPCKSQSKEDAAATWGQINKLRTVAQREFSPPSHLSGSGIVICGGGRYWPMVYVAIQMCRECTDLPIQVWHRGNAEPIPYGDLRGMQGVTIRDATAMEHSPRRLDKWEIKTVALKNCGWERALYLDADAYLVDDPSPLLAMLDYDRFVFWSDLPKQSSNVKWEWYGMRPSDVPTVQGGQLAINLRAFWRELEIADWINQRSDYFYAHQYGDQDSWRVALTITGGPYRHMGGAPWAWPAFVLPIDHRPVIVHRPQSKMWGVAGMGQAAMHLPKEDRAWWHLQVREVGVDGAKLAFDRAYAKGLWKAGRPDGTSGDGSGATQAQPYVDLVNTLAWAAGWRRIIDLGSGDGRIASKLEGEIVTVDCAATASLQLDVDRDRDRLPSGDVALIKDVMQHWPEATIRSWLAWAKGCGKWKAVVITNDHEQNHPDCPTGGYRGLDPDKEPLRSIGLRFVASYLHKSVMILDCLAGDSLAIHGEPG